MNKSAYNFVSLSIVVTAILLAIALPMLVFRSGLVKEYGKCEDYIIEVVSSSGGEKTEMSFDDYVCSKAAAHLGDAVNTELVKALLIIERNNAFIKYKNSLYGEESFQKEDIDTEKGKAEYIRRAYEEVKNKFVLYEGEIVSLPYHLYSKEKTVSALFYGKDIPYLKEASTPEKEAERKISLSYNEVYRRLTGYLGITLVGDCTGWIKGISVDSLGKVATVHTLLEDISGEDFSKALGLSSVVFTYECLENSITFTLMSEGDGLGMSIYGANILANEGYTFDAIIEHYYNGCTVSPRYP